MSHASAIGHGAAFARQPGSDPDRPWLAAYPPGMPAEIAVEGLGTLVDLFDGVTRTYADRPAMLCFGAALTYGALGEAAAALAAWLQADGLAKGDRVAIMLPNVPAYAVALAGILKAGGIVVNVNPLYTPREFAGQVADAGARRVIALEAFAHVVAAAGVPGLDRVVLVGPGDGLGLKGRVVNGVARHLRRGVRPYRFPDGVVVRLTEALRRGRGLPFREVPVAPDDLAFLQYTGGTTGVAKGAMLSHANVVANVEQSQTWFDAKDGAVRRCVVTALPLYHIFALTACLFTFLRSGGSCLLIPNPRDCDGFVATLARHRFTHLMGVNTLFNALLNHPRIGGVDFSHLDYVIGGGTAVQRAIAERWKALTGNTIIEGYGLSETAPVVCVNRRGTPEFTGTIGLPLPSTLVSLRGADGRAVAVGEPGELCVRGPQVMRGYWNRPDETAQATTADGYFRTGDLAVMQADGQFRIVDRIKDMILVSGFNVYPNEVEDVLAGHPGILECAVVGAPSAETGEMVVAHVVLRDPAVSPEAIRAHARTQLTGYKVPRQVVLHEALPKTNVGKVLRRVLRDAHAPPG